MTLKYKDVSIIIISFKSNKNVINLLSLIKDHINIVIVENSKDLSLKEYFKKNKNITIISRNNIGFGPAINDAVKLINTKYFLVLNPDLSKINEKFIKSFLDISKKIKDNFGVMGPRYNNLENDKSLVQSKKEFDLSEIECVSGAAMFFLKKNFDEVNGFDNNIFLYFEENDICKRLIKKNKKNFQINSIKIDHNRGTSFISCNQNEKNEMKLNSIWHFAWSKFYFLKKNKSYLIALVLILPFLIKCIFRILLYSIYRDKYKLDKYITRLDGFVASILLKKSHRRPDLKF